jgi:hypothetical protein
MPDSPERPNAARNRMPAIALWTTFIAILVLGLVLYFRFSGRVLPFLDVASER